MSDKQKHILIVDDDATQLMIASKYLTQPGVTVVMARTARDALQKLQTEKFNLLITDYRMPNMDGLELLEAMKASGVSCPVILITGSEDLKAINAAYRLGIVTFASKPVNWKILCTQVADILQTHSS